MRLSASGGSRAHARGSSGAAAANRIVARGPLGRLLVGQLEVDVFERRPGDRQAVELAAASRGPEDERLEVTGGCGRAEADSAVDVLEVDSSGKRKLGQGDACWRVKRDDGGPMLAAGEGRRVPYGDDAPCSDHRHSIGEALRLLHVVRGEQDGRPKRAEPVDQLPGA